MTITTNIKKDIKITNDLFIADTFIKRLRGFMFRKDSHHDAIMLKPCNSIHTFFMKFNIDVLFVNDEMEVIKKIDSLPPGKVILPIKEAYAVIEAKEGLFKDIAEGYKIYIDDDSILFD